MKTINNSFEILDTQTLAFSEDQVFKLLKALKERNSKKGLESFGLSILIVEDQDFSRKLLYDLLARQFVYTCHVAKNAAEALELYATHAPDIVFMDIVLPEYSGHDIAVLIKNHDPQSYIVMVTANNILKDVETAKHNHVQGYITKPYSRNKIQSSIDHYIKLQEQYL